jgi:MBG domain (YGX type)
MHVFFGGWKMLRSLQGKLFLLVMALTGSMFVLGSPLAVAQPQESAPEKRPSSPDEYHSQASQSSGPEHDDDDLLLPLKRNLWFQQQRAYPNAHIPRGAYWRAQMQRQAILERRRAENQRNALQPSALPDLLTGITWTPDGPQPIAAYYGPTPYSGRATSLAVHSTDPNTVYLGTAGGGVWKTTDGGQTWNPLTDSQASLAIGAVAIDPNNPNTVFAGTGEADFSVDSYYGQGLLKSTDAGQTWTLIRTPFNLYTGSLAWANGEQSGYCGDGGGVYVDPQAHYAYAHCQGGPANWAANPTGDSSTTSWVSAQSGISPSDRWPWVADIKGDQQTISTVYTGTNHLYQSTDSAASWTSISPDLTGGNSVITTIAVAPTDSNTIYTGAGDGTVSVTTNALAGTGAIWKTLSGLPSLAISKIVVQPDSANDVYVALNGFAYSSSVGHVYHSTNGGITWVNITGDLPNTPVDSIVVDPSMAGTIYLATDTGVYYTQNSGVNWAPLGHGLPNVVVQDILMDVPTRTLRVITHGRGAWDAVVPAAGTSQTITFPNPGPQTYGAPPVTLNATASSGLPVSYAVTSGPATLTGSALTITGAGSITVQATQAGNTVYSAAVPVSIVVTVTQAPLTVTVNGANKVYGTANPPFSGTISGLVNGDLVTATYSSTATSTSPVGNYAITAILSGAAAVNYSPAITPATLTITKAALAAAANNQAVAFGAAIPALTGTLTGVVAGDGITASFSSVAQGSAVGTYPIVAALSDPNSKLSNYNSTLTNGALVIYNSSSLLPLWLPLNSATAGGAGFTLTVNGANFASNSLVLWNGAVRTTKFVSSAQLTAAIPAADLQQEGTKLVTVSNPAPNAATSAALPFVVMTSAPVPAISRGSISDATDSSGNHELTLTGSDFVAGSVMKWNNATLTALYVSPWQISAVVPASDSVSLPAAVTVTNPLGASAGFVLP